MNLMHIEKLDLNLLRLFDAVFRARSVSRAAEALGLTQPAASHGLTRLRLLLGDALFTRTPGGVAPTPRAERLAVPVQVSSSTPYFTRTVRFPWERFLATTGRNLRWRSSWHSPSAMITLRPLWSVVIASLSTLATSPTR